MNREENNSQKKVELEQLQKIRQTFHEQQRQSQINQIITKQRNAQMNQTGSNETQTIQLTSASKVSQQAALSKLITKSAFFISKIKDRDSTIELIRIAKNNQFSNEQKQDLLEILFDRLSSKSTKQDPVQQHQLMTLNLFIQDRLTKEIMYFYVLLFVKIPNLLTIIKILETWLIQYQEAADYLEEICTQYIKDIQGTVVQFICNKDNQQNYKGRLEMLKLLINYIGNQELLSAFFMLGVADMMDNCSDYFFKEIFHVLIALFKNMFFNQIKFVEKLVKKINSKLSDHKNEILNNALEQYYQANQKNTQNSKSNQISEQMTQNKIL